MTINTDGTITIPFPPTTEKLNGEKVRADHMEDNFEAITEGIDAQIDRYGKKTVQANISMGSHRLINLGTPVANADGANKAYVDGKIANIPDATTSVKGLIEIATEEEAILGADATKAITPATLNKVVSDVIVDANKQMPYKYLAGFDCADEGSGVIGTAVGYCRDETNAVDMSLTEAISKAIGLTWDEGDNEGGMAPDVSVSPSSTYQIFAIGTLPVEATNGKFTTPNIAANISNFQAISDGYLRITVDGVHQDLSGLNFSTITSLSGIALILNNSALAGCLVSVVGNTLVFTSLTTGASSTVNIGSVPGGSGTDVSLSDYLNASAGTIVNGTNFEKSVVDIGFDTSLTAANLLNASGAPYLAGYRYYRKVGKFTTDDVSAIDICAETENSMKTNFSNITQYGRENLAILMSFDQTAGITINPADGTYTPEFDGWFKIEDSSNANSTLSVYVDGVLVYRFGATAYMDRATMIFVAKNRVITWAGMSGSVRQTVFYPCKTI